jgi:translocation protein SEC63
MSGTDYNYDEQVPRHPTVQRTVSNTAQGQFFPFFILTVTTLVTVPTTISFLRPSKGAPP